MVRADGSPNMTMAINLVGAIINTILDALFVAVFGWGMTGAAVATIIGHLARFLPMGEITLSELVPPEHQEAILKVIQTIGKGETKTAIKSLCPPEVTYQEIELMLGTQF